MGKERKGERVGEWQGEIPFVIFTVEGGCVGLKGGCLSDQKQEETKGMQVSAAIGCEIN